MFEDLKLAHTTSLYCTISGPLLVVGHRTMVQYGEDTAIGITLHKPLVGGWKNITVYDKHKTSAPRFSSN